MLGLEDMIESSGFTKLQQYFVVFAASGYTKLQ